MQGTITMRCLPRDRSPSGQGLPQPNHFSHSSNHQLLPSQHGTPGLTKKIDPTLPTIADSNITVPENSHSTKPMSIHGPKPPFCIRQLTAPPPTPPCTIKQGMLSHFLHHPPATEKCEPCLFLHTSGYCRTTHPYYMHRLIGANTICLLLLLH
jgi:hypothetical protein